MGQKYDNDLEEIRQQLLRADEQEFDNLYMKLEKMKSGAGNERQSAIKKIQRETMQTQTDRKWEEYRKGLEKEAKSMPDWQLVHYSTDRLFGNIYKEEIKRRERELQAAIQKQDRIIAFIGIEKIADITEIGLTNKFDTKKLTNIPSDNGLCYSVLPLGDEANGQITIACSDGRKLCILVSSYDGYDYESNQDYTHINIELRYSRNGKTFCIRGITARNNVDRIIYPVDAKPYTTTNNMLSWNHVFNEKEMMFSDDELDFVINILNRAMNQNRLKKDKEAV